MRNVRPVAALLFVAAAVSPAFADNKVDGSYEVKFEEMSTNCDPPRFAYQRGTVEIKTAKSSLTVNIATIPLMNGVPGKSGKINAKTPKKLATTVQGLDGTYRVSGRVDDAGVLSLVLVAEFAKTGETKTLCTQSWNVSGVRQATADKPVDKKVKKSSMDFFSTFED
ncbi:MAG TPA: hypothetical protein VIV40_19520 [Kofleriaceae bacterium]